jgi:crossover junction endodeoxyribonuclease RuvC
VIVLGIDPGTQHAGFAVLQTDGRTETVLDYGTLHLPPSMDHTLRLQTIYQHVADLIDRHLPDECAVEMPFYGKNAQSMLKLGRAQAAVMLAAVHRQVPVAQYAPAEIKKAVVGSGRAAKEQVWYMLQAQLGVTDDRGLDASDALGVALCHLRRAATGASAGAPKTWAAFVDANPGRVKG